MQNLCGDLFSGAIITSSFYVCSYGACALAATRFLVATRPAGRAARGELGSCLSRRVTLMALDCTRSSLACHGSSGHAVLKSTPSQRCWSATLAALHRCATSTLTVASDVIEPRETRTNASLACALGMLGYTLMDKNASSWSFRRGHYTRAGLQPSAHAQAGSPNCSASTDDGSFVLNDNATAWPAPHHFLDIGLANSMLLVVRNSTLLDIGAGSGQYGAYYDGYNKSLQHALQLRVSVNPTMGGHNRVGIPRYRGVDGMKNVEAYTSRFGPPGALVRYANICDSSLDLGVDDWTMSFEVGEHLPDSCLADYIWLLDRTNRHGVLLAWSAHTSGQCHVNPRPGSALICYFALLGYQLDRDATVHGRHRARLNWLKHDYLVLRRQKGESEAEAPAVRPE